MGNRDGARLGGFGRGNTFGWGVVQGSRGVKAVLVSGEGGFPAEAGGVLV
jgi:hypothetical protein